MLVILAGSFSKAKHDNYLGLLTMHEIGNEYSVSCGIKDGIIIMIGFHALLNNRIIIFCPLYHRKIKGTCQDFIVSDAGSLWLPLALQ